MHKKILYYLTIVIILAGLGYIGYVYRPFGFLKEKQVDTGAGNQSPTSGIEFLSSDYFNLSVFQDRRFNALRGYTEPYRPAAETGNNNPFLERAKK